MRTSNLAHPRLFLRECTARVSRAFSFQRSRLGLKFLSIAVGTVLLGTLLSSLLTLYFQHQQIVESAHASAQHTGTVIQASLEHAMLSNDLVMLSQMLRAIAGEASLDRVTILDRTGRAWLSSSPAQAVRPFDRTDPLCHTCHAETADLRPVATLPTCQISGQTMLTIREIPNEPACYACHDSASRTLGILVMETPLAGLEGKLATAFWQDVLSALIIFLLLVGLLMPALGIFVIQPVVALARNASEFGAGNLDFPSPSHRGDELGELAVAFDTMRQRLKLALVEKERRNRELEILNEITRAASRLLAPQQVLDLTVNVAVNSLGVQAGAIYLLDHDSGGFSLHACHGMTECEQMACRLWGFNRVLAGLLHSGCQPMVSVAITPNDFYREWQDPEGRSFVGVSLRAKGKLLGAMAFVTFPHQQVTAEGAKILQAMGEEIGPALAHAIHFQDVRNAATLEERERLAREMHDSLAQALGYLKMKASQADDLLTHGQIAQARANLREVKEIAGETYFDVREAIFGLRHLAPPEAEFVPALKEYLSEYQMHYGVKVRLILDESHPLSFPAEVNIQLTRIIQEALTNVRKHARVKQATLHFAREEHCWRVTVEDEGQGFDPERVPRSGQAFLGLHIMRERADGIGATFHMESKPGHGTSISLRIPLASEYDHEPTFAYPSGR